MTYDIRDRQIAALRADLEHEIQDKKFAVAIGFLLGLIAGIIAAAATIYGF